MSEAKQLAARATHELTVTEHAHAAFREKCLTEAVTLATLGKKDEAYTKLLMVVAIDGVRTAVLMMKNDATIEDGVTQALAPANTPPN